MCNVTIVYIPFAKAAGRQGGRMVERQDAGPLGW